MPLNNLVVHPLTHVREQRGWTLQHVADIVAAGQNMSSWKQKVYRWERGVVPEISAQYALAEAVGVPREIVDAHPWPSWLLFGAGAEPVDDPWTAQNATRTLAGTVGALDDRRGFLLLSGTSLAAVATGWTAPWLLVPTDKVAATTDGGRVDDEIMTALERRLSDLWVLDDLIGGERCSQLADADLHLVTGMLQRGSYTTDIQRRLYSAAAGLCRMAGWGSFDGGRPAAADRYWHAGLRAAKEAKDIDGGVYILSNMAMQRFYDGDGKAAIDLLDASRESQGRLSGTVLAMLDTWQVRAHATLGEGVQAAKALARAEAHWERRRPEDDPSWIYWMQRPSTTIEPNLAMIQLGQPGEVETNLSNWIELDGQDYPRDHALALTVVASAQIAMGELDTAVATGRKALAILKEIDSGRVGGELKLLLDDLPDERVTREFREEVAAEDS
jgi:transcriptional regulator with XRE-family HTH domain